MKTLLVLLGPTGVGKTALSIQLAQRAGAPIISADSRQLYKDLVIGTAAPDPQQLAAVKHYMVGTLALTDYYSASQYEEDALLLLDELYKVHPSVVLTGGSMMYIDAICKGIDEMPTVTPEVRDALWLQYEKEGLEPILGELKEKDPVHYKEVDRSNYKRVIHAVEMCRMTNQLYSSFRTSSKKERPFRIIKIGLTRPREELCERINQRVDEMVKDGLIEEARKVYPYRHLNSLNTVGYKELFNYFDGEWSLEYAIEKIKRNSRVYARKQMTWFKRDKEIHWFHPEEKEPLLKFLEGYI
ncbi:MAG: tRNA (adenosine(37)-N6)-dimethylallyltransferase MiaA [Tannerella sp.]|jgi:tRNA dimethylallyltransferase|nr:tRNA (adenosine(37)-N6)-dimethylallyltransferase MiaA [Tannerella sp.]